MPADVTRLLCIGDMHLGRASGRLPAEVDRAAMSPRAAWRRAVAAAQEHAVQAVILAGDVVDALDDRFEAFGALQTGVAELLTAGIPVLAVAGNHDGVALPRLADLMPRFTLLGRGGRWQSCDVPGPGGGVRVVGWSFPAERWAEDPASLGLPARAANLPTIGVLHTDLDRRGSPYAATTSAALRAAGYDAWLLGHQHAPSLGTDPRTPGYLGSLVGLDPTETGPRGPWLLEASPAGVHLRHLPLAPLRWQPLGVDVTGIGDVALELPERVLAALRDDLADPAANWGEARVVGYRVTLHGRTRKAADVERIGHGETLVGRTLDLAGVAAFVDAIAVDLLPDHDLAALARSDTPPGLLARRLLELADQRGSELVAEGQRTLADLDLRFYGELGAPPAPASEVRARLLQSGYRALDALLAQQPGAGDATA